jgi:hypothetical protein
MPALKKKNAKQIILSWWVELIKLQQQQHRQTSFALFSQIMAIQCIEFVGQVVFVGTPRVRARRYPSHYSSCVVQQQQCCLLAPPESIIIIVDITRAIHC